MLGWALCGGWGYAYGGGNRPGGVLGAGAGAGAVEGPGDEPGPPPPPPGGAARCGFNDGRWICGGIGGEVLPRWRYDGEHLRSPF